MYGEGDAHVDSIQQVVAMYGEGDAHVDSIMQVVAMYSEGDAHVVTSCEGSSKIHRLYVCKVYFWSQNNIICINENLGPLVTSTESVTASVPKRSKK